MLYSSFNQVCLTDTHKLRQNKMNTCKPTEATTCVILPTLPPEITIILKFTFVIPGFEQVTPMSLKQHIQFSSLVSCIKNGVISQTSAIAFFHPIFLSFFSTAACSCTSFSFTEQRRFFSSLWITLNYLKVDQNSRTTQKLQIIKYNPRDFILQQTLFFSKKKNVQVQVSSKEDRLWNLKVLDRIPGLLFPNYATLSWLLGLSVSQYHHL